MGKHGRPGCTSFPEFFVAWKCMGKHGCYESHKRFIEDLQSHRFMQFL